MKLSRPRIVILTLAVEGALCLAFFAWFLYRDYDTLHLVPELADLFIGIGRCIPLLAVNFLLFGPLSSRVRALHSFYEFKETVVRPLAAQLDWKTAAFVSFAAGLGEEFFFRGLLQAELGIFGASLLLALLHFGPAVRQYFWVAFIYFCIGLYFGQMFEATQSLWACIITHALYDYIALLYMRYYYVSPTDLPPYLQRIYER